MYEVFDVQKALPLIAEKLQLNPNRTKVITEIRPSGKKNISRLDYSVSLKEKKVSKKYDGPLSIAYTIDDIQTLDLKFNYLNSYGVVASFEILSTGEI